MTAKSWLPIRRWLHKSAQNVVVALIATMFICFLLQIVFRYFLNRPLGWTEEVSLLCWVWVVLWGAAFILSDEEEVRFDLIYGVVSERMRRVFVVVSSIALIVLLAISLPASWRYVAFMKREHSAYLHVPFNYLYSIYVIFAVACIVKHGCLVWKALRRKGDPTPIPADHGGSPS
jgi:TRAP-type C4-dicarboxylate transport system permease small subunit